MRAVGFPCTTSPTCFSSLFHDLLGVAKQDVRVREHDPPEVLNVGADVLG